MMPYSDYKKKLKDSGDRFRADTTDHEMTVLHDDGLYRHLRFKKPGTSFYWFDIITWPGNLMIRGDMGNYAFARTEDMFTFFRPGKGEQGINPGYWAEKLTAPEPDSAKEFSEKEFKSRVKQAYDDFLEAGRELEISAATLWERIEEDVLGDDWLNPPPTTSNEAQRNLHEFTYPEVFTDCWEWDLTDWTHRFLWNCHAILHAITTYDKGSPGG